MMNSCFIAEKHGSFLDPVEDYCDEEGAVERWSMLKHKVAESFLKEENYEGLEGDRGIVEHNH